MINQNSSQQSVNPRPMSSIESQSMSTTVQEMQAPVYSVEKTQTTTRTPDQNSWSLTHNQKYQEFMALQSAHLLSQSSTGFDLSTVGHDRSTTAMIQPPFELPHVFDLLQESAQQTPASLVATRVDQRATNQKKEARKQRSMAVNVFQQKDHPSPAISVEGQSLNAPDE
jgi:hypothetical protein